MSKHKMPSGRGTMRTYAKEILDAIEALGNESKLPQDKLDYLQEMYDGTEAAAKVYNNAKSKARAAKTKSDLAHGTKKGQSIKKHGSLKNAIRSAYKYLEEAHGEHPMLLHDYGLRILHTTPIGIDEEGVARAKDSTTGNGATDMNQPGSPNGDTGAQPKED